MYTIILHRSAFSIQKQFLNTPNNRNNPLQVFDVMMLRNIK